MIKIKDLKDNSVYYDVLLDEILYIQSHTPTWEDEGVFFWVETSQGLKFACHPSEADCVNLIELGEL